MGKYSELSFIWYLCQRFPRPLPDSLIHWKDSKTQRVIVSMTKFYYSKIIENEISKRKSMGPSVVK